MGDAENALPPSKKRAAGRELSRDTPIDDDEEDTTELEAGTFKRASDDVLATRRIVKVRRQQTNSAPSSNPFAGIRLVTPTESSAKPSEATTETQLAGKSTTAEDETKQLESKTNEVEDKTAANKDAAEESNAENGSKIGNEDQKDAANESTSEIDKQLSKEEKNLDSNDKKENSENKDKEDNNASKEPSAEGGNLKSFQQLSSTQNAFTGFAGSGFSSSSLSFGSGSIFGIKSDKPDGSGFGSGSGPNFGLGLTNSGSSIFGTSGTTAVSKSDGSRLSTLQEVVVETGEENEKVVFNADSVLFEFVDGGWKERGKGELKVNETKNETEKKARLLMRSKGNFRLILNARLYPEMKLTDMEKKGVTFACINSATEGKDSLSTFALKFKDGSIVEEFKAAIAAHKAASTVLKTPENSPKASDV